MWYRGTQQKKAVLDLLEKHKYLRTWMIAQAVFPSKHQAQVSLKKMYSAHLIKRFRVDSREDLIYHVQDKISKKWPHWDMINTFHFRFLAQLKPWQKILHYEFEYKYNPGQADGFYVVKTSLESTKKFFLEADTDTSGCFDKVSLYNQAYLGYWQDSFYADPLSTGVKSFPLIAVYTPRKKEIDRILQNSENHLTFITFSTSETVFQF